MKALLTLTLATILSIQCVLAGGSISWEDVKSRISKSDPELVKVIEKSFVLDRSGGALRLGPHFGERQGERIAPYDFGAEDVKTKEKCVLVIEESDDFELTGRFKFTRKPPEGKNQADGAVETPAPVAAKTKVFPDDVLRRRSGSYQEFSLVQIYWALPAEFFEGTFEDRITDLIRGRVQFVPDKKEIHFPGDGGQMSLKVQVVTQTEEKLVIHVTGVDESKSFWILERIPNGWNVLKEE